MKSITNRVQLIGHVGQDPEIQIMEDGSKLAKFSMATNEKFLNAQGEKVEKTHWHRVSFWNRAADLVEQYVTKGSHVAIEGKLTTRSWEDDHGVKHFRHEIVGRELMLF